MFLLVHVSSGALNVPATRRPASNISQRRTIDFQRGRRGQCIDEMYSRKWASNSATLGSALIDINSEAPVSSGASPILPASQSG